MFTLNKKILSASLAVSAALFLTACNTSVPASGSSHLDASTVQTTYANGKRVIDGGTTYPVVNGKTSQYDVNTEAHSEKLNHGRTPTAAELAAWDTDVTPIKLPPKGEGSVEDGEEIYEAQCVMCHGDFGSGGGGYPSLGGKGNAADLQKTLKNQRVTPDADGPVRLFGSYWPEASTMWWYIHDGMPHPTPHSLTVNETYALTAYMLSINEMMVGDVAVADDDEFVLTQDNFKDIIMPNKNGFVPEIRTIDGQPGTENVREFYAKAHNFGGQNLNQGAVRCMKDCQEPTAVVVRIAKSGGIKNFIPAMSVVKDLPAKKAAKGSINTKEAYTNNCAMCHGTGVAPTVGDTTAWAPYTDKGMDSVYKNAIHGTEAGMPPKGGSSLSDADFKLVVDYLITGK